MKKIPSYDLVADKWIFYLDRYFTTANHNHFISHTASTMDQNGYMDHLGFFIAMALDSTSWSPYELASGLELDIETIYDLWEYFSPSLSNYEEIPDTDVIWESNNVTVSEIVRDLKYSYGFA